MHLFVESCIKFLLEDVVKEVVKEVVEEVDGVVVDEVVGVVVLVVVVLLSPGNSLVLRVILKINFCLGDIIDINVCISRKWCSFERFSA